MEAVERTRGRIVIAGGTGLIGRSLVDRLVARGDRVIVLSRSPSSPFASSSVEVVSWTPGRRGDWERALVGATAVVTLTGANLASGRWSRARKQRFWDSRVVASRTLAEATVAADSPPQVFVQGSAVGYYGGRGDEVLTERSAVGGDYLGELCSAWEAASELVEEAGVRRAQARTGLVLSRGSALVRRLSLPFRLGVGGWLGDGRQWMPWIHLEDEVSALVFLLDHPDGRGPFNLVSPHPASNRDFSRSLGETLKRPCWLPVPAPILRLAMGEMSALALEGQRALPERLLALGWEPRYPHLGPALEDVVGAK